MAATASPLPHVVGRYALYDVIAAGGMATVHFGRLLGPVGFARTVAIKRLHAQFARDPEFVSMFLDEARLAARIAHPNVVQTVDVVALEGELFLVMEYVQGESLGHLIRAARRGKETIPVAYATAIVAGALKGLHAAHEARDERGEALNIVHRDVSPQNILVGVDGVPRVLDFGVAKAMGRLQTTRGGQVKGKMAYMAPEQLRGTGTDRRTDIYAAGVVLWEALTGRRLFAGDSDVEVFGKVLEGKVEPPSVFGPGVPPGLDAIVLRALAGSPDARFPTAREMARALEMAVPLVPTGELGEWVEAAGAEVLASRTQTVARIESDSIQIPQPAVQMTTGNYPAPPPPPVENPPIDDDPTDVSGRSALEALSAVRAAVFPFWHRHRTLTLTAGGIVVAGGFLALALTLFAPSRSGAKATGDLPPAPLSNAAAANVAPMIPPPVATPTLDVAATESAAPAASPPPASAPPEAPPSPPPRARPAATRTRPANHPLDGVLDSRQ